MTDATDWGDEAPPAAAPTQSLSKLCVASLVLGILSPLCCGLFTGIPAVICGHMGLSAVGDERGPLRGRGFAIAGLVLGYLSIVMTVAYFVFFGASGFDFEKLMEDMNAK